MLRPLLDRHVDFDLITTIHACDACANSFDFLLVLASPCKAPTSSHVPDASRGCFRAGLEGDGGKRDTRPRSQALPSPEQAVHEDVQGWLRRTISTLTQSLYSSTSSSLTFDYPASRSPAPRAVLRRTAAAPIVHKSTLQQLCRGRPHTYPARLPLGSLVGFVPVISSQHHHERIPHDQRRPTCVSRTQVSSATRESAGKSAPASKRRKDCTGRGTAAIDSVPGTQKCITAQRYPEAP